MRTIMMMAINSDITGIVNICIALIGALITAFLIPYIKTKTTAAQQDRLSRTIAVLVTAAEQLYDGAGRGAEKLKYVEVMLKNMGYTVDTEDITDTVRAQIEAAVNALKPQVNNLSI
ncbi:MAG: phage holin, LLH family [Christensenella sp.]